MDKFFIGVDVGGTNVDGLLVDRNLAKLAFLSTPIRSNDGRGPVAVIIQLIEDLAAEGGVHDFGQIAAIGVGIPGLVDAASGRVELAVNLDEPSMELGGVLEDYFERPVFVENDANAVAQGAAKFLVKPSVKNLAFVTLGTGVGSGLILNGQIFHGSRNMAGEIGHMFVRESDIRCQCGGYGCLETFVAGPAISRIAQDAAAEQVTSLQKYRCPDAQAVFAEAANGDEVAQAIVDEVGTILGRALQGMIMSFDLEKIIIGGGISRAGDPLRRPILAEWGKMRADSVMAASMLLDEKIMMCPADYKAGAWGAVAVGLARLNVEKTNQSLTDSMVLA